jgi:hypothetical protein
MMGMIKGIFSASVGEILIIKGMLFTLVSFQLLVRYGKPLMTDFNWSSNYKFP